MTVRPEDYAPYHTFPEFHHGYFDYLDGVLSELHGVAAQAYDRGREYAMRRRSEAIRAERGA